MIILGEPDNVAAYFMCDGEVGLELQRAGFCPKYMGDDGTLYYKRTAKLAKYLEANGIGD